MNSFINYLQSFNAGELSSNIDGRSDLKIYQQGCRKLDNFLVLPQGGVERRTGTKHFRDTKNNTEVKLIPFDFSSTNNFVVEIGTNYIRVHPSDGSTPIDATGVTPQYLTSELKEIQHIRRFDTIILTHPNHEPLKLVRTTLAPTFVISEVDFIYPPLFDQNITATTITPSANTGTGISLTASADTFQTNHIGSTWGINYLRSGDSSSATNPKAKNLQKEVSHSTGTAQSNYINMSYSNWNAKTTGTWTGLVVIQRRIDSGSPTDYVVMGNTTGGTADNFVFSSLIPEQGNTELRISFVIATGDCTVSIEADSQYALGLVKITAVADAQNATADVVSVLGGTSAVTTWNEAAFSNQVGFPKAALFYQNRLLFTGSSLEPSTVYASVAGEIFNFLKGTTSDMSIKHTVDISDEAEYLEGKADIFMGTDRSTISVKSVNTDELLNTTNINTQQENSYGSANIQPVLSNDLVIFAQTNKLKLRALIYAEETNSTTAIDLNAVASHITGTGIKEMYIQKNPDQLIWCIKDDGDICILNYDRIQDLSGWSNITTDGDFISGTVIQGSGEDIIFVAVKRDSTYTIEEFQLRKNKNFYVDSGKQQDGGAAKTITASISSDITITANGHGYSNGDIVRIRNSGSKQLGADVFAVSDSATNTFKLKDKTATSYEAYNNTNDIVVTGAVESSTFNGTYELDSTVSTPYWNLKDSATGITISAQEDSPTTHYWVLRNNDGSVEFQLGATQTSQANLLNTQWWAVTYDNSDATKRAFRSATFGLNTGATVEKVYNEITGLNHLEGKTVQVVGDNNFVKEVTVSSNKITTDAYYNNLIAGLKFTSTLQPMPINPAIKNGEAQSRVKAITKVIVRFINTKGASVGEAGKQLTNFPVVNTSDKAGQQIALTNKSQRFFVGSDWERDKVVEVKQDLPYPMTVLSIASNISLGGA